MKKGDGVKKAVEAIYKLARDKSFRRKVVAVRTKAGIPAEGFRNEVMETAYAQKRPILLTLLDAVDLLKKYKLPPSYYWEMMQYLRFNRLRDAHSEALSVLYPNDRKQTTGNEETFAKLGQPYVGVFIHDASSIEDTLSFVREHWRAIKRSLKAQGGNTSRIRTSKNKERNLLISELNEKSKDELCDLAAIPPEDRRKIYKEQAIVRILKAYGYNSVTFEVVKKYILRPKLGTDKSRLKRSIPKKRR
jgi:hypothetical protein